MNKQTKEDLIASDNLLVDDVLAILMSEKADVEMLKRVKVKLVDLITLKKYAKLNKCEFTSKAYKELLQKLIGKKNKTIDENIEFGKLYWMIAEKYQHYVSIEKGKKTIIEEDYNKKYNNKVYNTDDDYAGQLVKEE